MSCQNLSTLFAALLLSWGCTSAFAQTSAKPAPSKPAAPATATGGKTLDGSKSSSDKVMSINELKECLRRQDELKTRGTDLERQRVELDSDRKKVEDETAAIKAQQAEVAQRNEAVKEFNARLKAFSESVTSWNARMEEVKEASGMGAERKRKELNNELVALKKAEASNKTEGDALMNSLQEAAQQVNARADAQQKMATDWNERNTKLNDASKTYEDNRIDWREECGNRRYREDDEKALRSGK